MVWVPDLNATTALLGPQALHYFLCFLSHAQNDDLKYLVIDIRIPQTVFHVHAHTCPRALAQS